MEIFLLIISTFVVSVLEPLLFALFSFSIFYVAGLVLSQKYRGLVTFVGIAVVSVVLDSVMKYPLGVYLISFLMGYFSSIILSRFILLDTWFYEIVKNTISSLFFYISLFFGIYLSFSYILSPKFFGIILASLVSGIIVSVIKTGIRGDIDKSHRKIKI